MSETRQLQVRSDIRRAAEATRRFRERFRATLRRSTALMTVGPVLFALLLPVGFFCWPLLVPGVLALVGGLLAILVFLGALVGFFVAPPLRRRYEHHRLRETLGLLTGYELEGVVRPLLQHPDPDTRKIAARCLRDLRRPTEPTPATPPPGRGDEASPTGSGD